MTEIIAALIGVVFGNLFQYLLWKRDKNFVNLINDNDFTVYSDQKAPDEIWKGFEKDFKSYNDSWIMEFASPEEYIETHRNRYNSPNCAMFRFLFFIGSNIGQFERFVKFQSMVHLGLSHEQTLSTEYNDILEEKINSSSLPLTLDYIEVYLCNEPRPNQTFFRGYKKSKDNSKLLKIALWYLAIDTDNNEPHLILKSHDGRFWKDLDEKWNKSRENSEKIIGKNIFNRYLEITNT